MRELDAHFDAYEHLKELPRESEALFLLRKAASLVKPIMRKRGWKVRTLAEFLPPDPRLQGLNINKTEKIYVRLRYSPDPKQFLPMELVVDTLLHELSHIVWGPHDHNFQRLWDELRDEHQTLLLKGFTGEGFLSEGHRLGGKHMPVDEMRRRARVAAEQRRISNLKAASSGRKLGGAPTPRGTDIRSVIASAAERRSKITQGCASGSKEVEKAAEEQSKRNGFRTKAEEDDANDLAIMNALIELMEEEETRKLNEMYGTPSAEGGLIWTPENGLEFGESSSAPVSAPPTLPSTPQPPSAIQQRQPSPIPLNTRPQPPTNSHGRPVSRLVAEDEARKQNKLQRPAMSLPTPSLPPRPTAEPTRTFDLYPSASILSMWTCSICTLENPMTYLCCDACGVERPASVSLAAIEAMKGQTQPEPLRRQQALGWNCGRCGTFMEHQWWTCSACGTMKVSS